MRDNVKRLPFVGAFADCQKRCVQPLAPSARGLRPQAVGERTVRLSEIFQAMARLSPSAPRLPKNSCRGALCARAHLSCEKLSRKSVATLGWRATNVRPAPLAVITNVRVDRRGRRPRRPVQFCVIANLWFAARANNVAPAHEPSYLNPPIIAHRPPQNMKEW